MKEIGCINKLKRKFATNSTHHYLYDFGCCSTSLSDVLVISASLRFRNQTRINLTKEIDDINEFKRKFETIKTHRMYLKLGCCSVLLSLLITKPFHNQPRYRRAGLKPLLGEKGMKKCTMFPTKEPSENGQNARV